MAAGAVPKSLMLIAMVKNLNQYSYFLDPPLTERQHPTWPELKGRSNPSDPKRGNKRQRGGNGLGHQRRHWNDAAVHTSQLQGGRRTKSDMFPLTQVPPEPLVLINSCVMIAANLAVCATISIFRLAHVSRPSP